MRIQYSPLIDVQVTLGAPEMDFSGVVKLPGVVKGKTAVMTMNAAEAAQLFRQLRALGVEEMAKTLGVLK